MDQKTKIRLSLLVLLATAVLSLILVLLTDSWPIAILLAVAIMAAVVGGFIWNSKRQQKQFLERLRKFDIDPENGKVSEPNLRRMYHSGGQAQKDVVTIMCVAQKWSTDEAHKFFKNRPTRQQMNQMAQQQNKGQRRPRTR